MLTSILTLMLMSMPFRRAGRWFLVKRPFRVRWMSRCPRVDAAEQPVVLRGKEMDFFYLAFGRYKGVLVLILPLSSSPLSCAPSCLMFEMFSRSSADCCLLSVPERPPSHTSLRLMMCFSPTIYLLYCIALITANFNVVVRPAFHAGVPGSGGFWVTRSLHVPYVCPCRFSIGKPSTLD